MFYYIRGKLALLDPNFAVIDAMGVGYKLTISQNTYSLLPHGEGEKNVLLYTYYSVREDGVELFGFFAEDELNLFKLLISVSGIGPKAAMSLLSFLSPTKLAIAICNEDKKLISKASGIGPKTAARIILELKDKFKNASVETQGEDVVSMPAASEGSKTSEAVEALMVLGFNRATALDAISKLDVQNSELEDIIRLALKNLMK